MLTDTQIERWSRQIILPEVGGRGQVRMLAARLGVLGGGLAAEVAVDLLRRAGVPVACGVVPQDAEVVVDLDDGDVALPVAAPDTPVVRGRVAGAAGSVDTLVGRPCARCAPTWAPPAPAPGHLLAPVAGRVLASLAAAEAMRVVLARPAGGRRHVFDLDAGTFAAEALAGDGCAACGGRR
ncbi:MAG TPA: ThiF family adenylyltransferase [Candidatus Binatia bacterium]|nr:ThiF family adenylyltransferase [Candidatus Binatia bacterium]